MDLALNNLQGLICHKTQTNKQSSSCGLENHLVGVQMTVVCNLSKKWAENFVCLVLLIYLLSLAKTFFFLF